jgi:hypothetical protein
MEVDMIKGKRMLVGGLALVAGASVLVVTQVAQAAEATTVSYPASAAEIANPERGPYHFNLGDCGKAAFGQSTLEKIVQDENVTLVQCLAYLDKFKTADIDAGTLTNLTTTFANSRAAGAKVILRFAYTEAGFGANGEPPPGDDATPAQVAKHITQLRPVLAENEDVISVLQAGFIGTWGEWYYTQNFGNNGNGDGDPAAQKARTSVAKQMLDLVPNRKIQVRTPGYKTAMTELTAQEAARVGHYNDCFLASATDFGTYTDLEQQRPGLKVDTLHVPVGGETCTVDTERTTCDNAVKDLTDFHWSFLNLDYNKDALDGPLKTCMPEIRKKLGYRFTLKSGTFPAAAAKGSALPITLNLHNDGYAAPYNPRGAELVLRNKSTNALTRLPLKADPQDWAAGATQNLSESVTVPADLAAGDYELLLNLPDPELADNAKYSIQLANTGTWESATGLNKLNATVAIS